MPATQIKRGMVLDLDGELLRVQEFTHVTPGKGQAVMQTKLRNMRTGTLIDKRFRSAETLEPAHVDRRTMQYLYLDGDLYTFMDLETYEQSGMTAEKLAAELPYLLSNTEVKVTFVGAEALGVELPGTVEMEVTQTDPAIKGATAAAQTKPATLETGLVVQVPPFISQGDRVRVDTGTGQYLTRAT
ncbi:MAG TPA: elongation factor P [Acidobacteriota bacterium]|nr:elongation factor P [Acidobacteriota bacterium]